MNFSELELPSNKKFGYFFSFIFLIAAGYFYAKDSLTLVIFSTVAALIFLLITLIKSDLLLPINKLWMLMGLFLGFMVTPIVLGLIFFGLFTPIAFLLRMVGRDELLLKQKKKVSYWNSRDKKNEFNSFKNQF